jgi:O-succinylbenzoate synthase
MKIQKIHARELRMKLISPFETSFGSMQKRRILLIELVTDESIGWGELTAGENPFYNSETTDTAWLMLRKYLAPCLLGQNFTHPDELTAKMEFVRGHEMSKAMLETAAWDAVARAKDISLALLLGPLKQRLPQVCRWASMPI